MSDLHRKGSQEPPRILPPAESPELFPATTPSDSLLRELYTELRTLAGERLRRERRGHSLGATELVHEAYLRLADRPGVVWDGRGHFFAAAAEAMRRILIEHARNRARHKRGGHDGRPPAKVSLADLGSAEISEGQDPDVILALDAAIGRMKEQDARMAAVVHLRYYAGLSIEETALALGVSERTVKREWTYARARLFEELSDDSGT